MIGERSNLRKKIERDRDETSTGVTTPTRDFLALTASGCGYNTLTTKQQT